MTRVCHCVGYITNPGGVCCMELPKVSLTIPNTYPYTLPYTFTTGTTGEDMKTKSGGLTPAEIFQLRELLAKQNETYEPDEPTEDTEPERHYLAVIHLEFDFDQNQWELHLTYTDGEEKSATYGDLAVAFGELEDTYGV